MFCLRPYSKVLKLVIRLIDPILLMGLILFVGGPISAQQPVSEEAPHYQTTPSEIVSDEIVIKFKPDVCPIITDEQGFTGIPPIDRLLTKFEVSRIRKQFVSFKRPAKTVKVDLSGFYLVRFPPRFDPREVAAEFSQSPAVEYAQVIGIHRVYPTTPNDARFTEQWALNNTGQTGGTADADVDAPEAWDLCQGHTSVILAIVDTGVDWKHPDLGGSGPNHIDGNIWINSAEYSGTTGVDDDGNGYVDDIRGWDWVDGVSAVTGEDANTPDNDPMDFNGHGTHCAGIADAITNNATGVAGLAWGCKIMALRVGWSGRYLGQEVGYIRMDFAAQAIVYATDNGATAINCSWGSSDTGGLGAAVDYAIQSGVLVAVAAGNDGDTSQDYLNSRGDCIDVAATDHKDQKASWSNYGTWVDVSAPGVNILNTYFDHTQAEPNCHTYASLSGTSMATPHVVGLIGLLKAYEPSLSASEIKTKILCSADNINAVNLGYENLLGSGRINAYQALSSVTLRAHFIYSSHTLGGGAGGNGKADPGETGIQMTVTLTNDGSENATGLSATLSTTDTYITITSNSSTYPNLTARGGSGASVTPYVFNVSPSCPQGHMVTFQLNVTCTQGYSNTTSFTITVGTPLTKPDLTLTGTTDIAFSKSYPPVSYTVTITATIHNNGANYNDIDATPFAQVTEGGTSGYYVDITQWDAQSFTAISDCYLAKVSLAAWDVGSDTTDNIQFFKVSIQGNTADNKPDGIDLSSVESYDFAPSTEWHDFVFSTPAKLTSGTKYWIVARSTAPDVNGYAWRFNRAPDTYSGGESKASTDGVTWSATGANEDFWFKVYKYTYNTVVGFYDGDPDFGGTQISTNQILSPIASLGTKTASVNWIATAGYHVVYVAIDRPGTISESSESNNEDHNAISVAPGWGSYSDYPPQTGCDLFNSAALSTVYMKGSGLLRNHDYKAAYYDGSTEGSGILVQIEVGSSGPFDIVPPGDFWSACNFTHYQGTAPPGTWHVVVCETSYSVPSNYSNIDAAQIIADDTFTVTSEAIPEFPSVPAAIGVAILCGATYLWMRRRIIYVASLAMIVVLSPL